MASYGNRVIENIVYYGMCVLSHVHSNKKTRALGYRAECRLVYYSNDLEGNMSKKQ